MIIQEAKLNKKRTSERTMTLNQKKQGTNKILRIYIRELLSRRARGVQLQEQKYKMESTKYII